MATQTDLMVVLEDRPGMLAGVAETLGDAGINIDGICALTSGGSGIVHLLVAEERAAEAQRLLEAGGFEVATVRDVWVAQCPDRPGELGRLLRRIAAADVNCDLVYLTTTGRVVIGAEELERITGLLS